MSHVLRVSEENIIAATNNTSHPIRKQLAGIDLTIKNKWSYLIAFFGGSALIAVLGKPTLFQIFSKDLEVRLWDTSDIIKNNLIAMGLSFGGVMLWTRFKS